MTTEQDRPSEPGSAKSGGRRSVLFLFAMLGCVALFSALGLWQVKRLAWKQDLIAKVERRIHAPAVPAPDRLSPHSPALAESEYLRVSVQGRYIPSATALALAVTDLGSGYWVMTPLRTGDGRTLYINRGFVPTGASLAAVRRATPAGPVSVRGLLRLSEPKGAFLRSNDPTHDRWYSRDLEALSAKHGLVHAAPYFVDAEAEAPRPGRGAPVMGLTVVRFPNNHLSYALTWFTMALLTLAAGIYFHRKSPAE